MSNMRDVIKVYVQRVTMLFVTACGLAMLGAGCSVDASDAQSAVCAQLEQASPQELERIFQVAKTSLESQGITFDAKLWADPDTFQRFMSEVDKASQCSSSATTKSVQSALHEDRGPDNYCGPGHHTWLPTVSRCLNRACFVHDSCYGRCSEPTSLSGVCVWASETASCDNAFFAVADACDNTGAKFRSWMVLRAAHGLALLPGTGLGCAPGMTCPKDGELGQGVCAKDPTGTACATCLAGVDAACVDGSRNATDAVHSACTWAPIDPVCLSADCDGAQQCYGAPSKGSTACPGNKQAAGDFVNATCQAKLDAGCCTELKGCFNLVIDKGAGGPTDDCNTYTKCVDLARSQPTAAQQQAAQTECDLGAPKAVQDAYDAITTCATNKASAECQ